MGRSPKRRKIAKPKARLALPDLDQSKAAVIGSLRSPESQRGYRHAIDEFVAQGEPLAKVAMTKQMQDINQELGARLKQRYVATYWGRLSQEGYDVHVWKLQFSDGKDDYLVTMAVKDQKVAGLWIH